MEELIRQLKQCGVLKSGNVEQALRAVDRADFVPAALRDLAYDDQPLPIGLGQTISQPYTVVFMLELLAVAPGQIVVDVGAGSGWQTALLAALVGERGQVHAFELAPELVRFAEANLAKYPELKRRITFYRQSAAKLPPALVKNGFNRLIAAAAVWSEPPPVWRSGLRPEGRLVYPQQRSLVLETKDSLNRLTAEEYPGFVFVPFVD